MAVWFYYWVNWWHWLAFGGGGFVWWIVWGFGGVGVRSLVGWCCLLFIVWCLLLLFIVWWAFWLFSCFSTAQDVGRVGGLLFFIPHFWRVFGGFGLDFLKIPIFSGFLGFFYPLNYISLRGRR